jgi:GMP synthase-like glutamine amidotransferase
MSNLTDKRILVVNDHMPTYQTPFRHLGLEFTNNIRDLEDDPDNIALVVFTGGSDVSPSLYGRPAHPYTSSNKARDMEESEVFRIAKENNIPMAGICRGAQFLCVMGGGRLVQHLDGHNGGNHGVYATYPDGGVREISVTSSHHQMQYPFDMPQENYAVLAWGTESRATSYAFERTNIVEQSRASMDLASEPDVIFYPHIQALGAQYHPEWMSEDTDGFKYFTELVNHYLVPLMEKRYGDRERKEATKTAG